jgi:hypothetical protein
MTTQTAELARAPQHHRRGGRPRRRWLLLAVAATVLTVGFGTWKLGSGDEPAGTGGRAPVQSTTPLVSEPPIAVAPPPDAPAADKASRAGKHHTP